jgi:hypothetical protein
MKRRIQLLIVLLLWPTYAYFYQAGEHNEASRLNLVRAFVEDGVLWVDPYAWNSADQIVYQREGVQHYYSGKAPGSSMLAAVPFKLASELLWSFDLPEGVHWHAVVYATAIATVNLLSALAAAVLFGVCWRAVGSAWAALFGVAAVWLGTILFPFSTLQFGHAQAAAFLVFAFALVYGTTGERAAEARHPGWALFAAGFFAGFAVVIEYPTVILVALLGLYLLHGLGRAKLAPPRRTPALLASFVGGGLCAAALLAAYNLAAFGTLLYVPYEAYAQGGGAFQAHARGVLGVSWPGLGSFLHVLGEITVRPQRGLVYLGFENFRVYATNPVLWIALPGLALLVARRETRREGVLAGAAAVCMLAFNACFGDSIVYWGGGASVGPRHVVPMLPLLALPIARVVRSLSWLFFPLLAVSVFYMLLASATEPRVGYEFGNPARDLFAANWLEGRFSLNRGALFDVERGLLTGDSTAFNLGKLAGLPGAWQLAPLMLWWLAIGGALVYAAARADAPARTAPTFGRPPPRLAPRLALAGVAAFALFVVATPLLASALD